MSIGAYASPTLSPPKPYFYRTGELPAKPPKVAVVDETKFIISALLSSSFVENKFRDFLSVVRKDLEAACSHSVF